MKRSFRLYAICWAIALVVFNVAAFAIPAPGDAATKFTAAFWIGYAAITIAFAGQLGCAFVAFRANNLKKMFYNLPLFSISYIGLAATMVVGLFFMLFPAIPGWIGAIVCLAVLAFTAVKVFGAAEAAAVVDEIDNKVATQTQFIKTATVNAQNIMNRAKNEEAKAECQKVYEALRYSDPMSSTALSVEEAKITVKLDELAAAVNADTGDIKALAEEAVLLVKERNNKCKAVK